MPFQSEFSKIYYAYNEQGNLELFFYNDITQNALTFNGFDFSYKTSINTVPNQFEEIDYSLSLDSPVVVESIRQSDDITFIKLKNGDIFQIYSMLENSDAEQNLTIYKAEEDKKIYTPLGVSEYYAALDRFESSEECKVLNEG